MGFRVKLSDVAHLLPPGEATPRRPRRKAEAVATLPHDTLIASGTVKIRPFPWTAPPVDRNGGVIPASSGNPQAIRYSRYSSNMELLRHEFMRFRFAATPYDGPVRVDTTFAFAGGGMVGDTDNLRKAAVDAMQGVFIENDRQVLGGMIWRHVHAGEDSIEFSARSWSEP